MTAPAAEYAPQLITVRVRAVTPVAFFITGTEPFRPGDTFPVHVPHRTGRQHTVLMRIVGCTVARDGSYCDVTAEPVEDR